MPDFWTTRAGGEGLGAMSEVVSVADGGGAARAALERCINEGGVALFPADGLYGLACDPLNPVAIERIHALKGRDDGKPSAVMYLSMLAMRELFGSLGPRTRDALGALLPGALTLVVANPEHRYPLACREDPERLGLRLIGGPLAGAGCALFQTSANRSGEPPPSRFADADGAIVAGVDLAIDGGELTGMPSTVVDLTGIESGGGWRILREGAVPRAELSRFLAETDLRPA
jgi:L-threonylcarbamoyladenylate synthase